jgi:hypothetical protein
MISARRIKAVILLAIVAFLIAIYVASSPSTTRSSAFYTSTRAALNQREADEANVKALESDDLAVQNRLREAEQKAKMAADRKGERFHGKDFKNGAKIVSVAVDHDAGVARKTLKGGSEKVLLETKGKLDKVREEAEKNRATQTAEERKAEAELNYILKRSPSK